MSTLQRLYLKGLSRKTPFVLSLLYISFFMGGSEVSVIM